MSTFEIEGGVPLRGTIRASGNKNAILPMIAACILTDQEVILDNVPDIIDVRHMLDVLVEIWVARLSAAASASASTWRAVRTAVKSASELCNKVRTSILCVAPPLAPHGLCAQTVSTRVAMSSAAAAWTRIFMACMKLGAVQGQHPMAVYDFTVPGPSDAVQSCSLTNPRSPEPNTS